MRHLSRISVLLSAALLGAVPALAQTSAPASAPAPAPAPAPASGPAPAAAAGNLAQDPVVAKVDQTELRMSDVRAVAAGMPEEYRQMPQQALLPMLVDQLIDRTALLKLARAQGLDKDAVIRAAMTRASDQALQNALISKMVGPQVTELAVKARYDATVAGKPGEAEVHARHILVKDEAKARDLIGQIQKGGDFVQLAKANSTDPGAADGGDLGWFKKGDMVPAFAEAAFALPDNATSPAPIKTQFGYHIIQTLGHRTATPPSFEQSREALRQSMIQEAVQTVVKTARTGVTVIRMGLDGQPARATDMATPPAAPGTDMPAAPATP